MGSRWRVFFNIINAKTSAKARLHLLEKKKKKREEIESAIISNTCPGESSRARAAREHRSAVVCTSPRVFRLASALLLGYTYFQICVALHLAWKSEQQLLYCLQVLLHWQGRLGSHGMKQPSSAHVLPVGGVGTLLPIMSQTCRERGWHNARAFL